MEDGLRWSKEDIQKLEEIRARGVVVKHVPNWIPRGAGAPIHEMSIDEAIEMYPPGYESFPEKPAGYDEE